MLGLFCAVFSNASYAQCSNSNIQYGTSNAPTTVGSLTTLSTCMYGGEYRLVNNMQAGSQYSFETCGDTDFDTQLTIYDNVTGAVVAYNDDFCGLQSKASFTSNGNSVRVLINKYFCTSQSSCMTLRVTRETGGSINPCNSISSLTCTNTGSFSLSGSGGWNNLGGPWSTPGAEQVFSFTPTLSGSHNIVVTNSSYYVDLYIKAGSCSPTGWTYIDDISSFGAATNSVSLTAGVTYYLLIDDENTSSGSGTISVECPSPAADPCASITNIAACDAAPSSFSLASGNGAWNPSGPWGTPGEEAVFSYTPSVSGAHDIQVTNSGYYVDLFYGTSCGPTGWAYISDIYTNETNTVNLTAGVTYYFLIDDENTSASSGTISVSCPCIAPPGGIDGSYTYNGDFSISGTTIGACDDCSLRPSNDRVYEVNVLCAGNYEFTTCSGTSWDTYLYLRTAACGGTSIAINDDACGLQSRITAYLQPGSYYIHVEGWSSSSQGAFNLSVLGNLDAPTIGAVVGPEQVCENESGVEYSVSGNFSTYSWSVPSGANITAGANSGSIMVDFGSNSGSVSVNASNSCGSNSSSSNVQVNLNPIADAGSDQIVFYGYTPMSCATLIGSATSGTPAYSYNWSSGDITSAATVCPQTSTTYVLKVTDTKGCSSTDAVTVCAVDVICYAGNSGNQKVEMCQIPPGNPANAHTICISPNAVPAHLANGCTLGACGEIDLICNSSAIAPDETNDFNKMGNNIYSDQLTIGEFSQYPNPASTNITLEFSTPTDENVNLTIVNIQGKRVASLYNSSTEANQAYKFNYDITNLQNGIYLIHFETSKGLVQKKFVVLK